MAGLTRITGLSAVLSKFKKADRTLGKKIGVNLKKAGLFVQRESQKICPVDQDNLRPGAETRNVGGSGFDSDIVVFYKADYSVYVHENMDAQHKPPTRAKFLEAIGREQSSKIFHIIAGK